MISRLGLNFVKLIQELQGCQVKNNLPIEPGFGEMVNQPLILKTGKHVVRQNRWENSPVKSEASTWLDKVELIKEAPKDIFDRIGAQRQTESITPEQASAELSRRAALTE